MKRFLLLCLVVCVLSGCSSAGTNTVKNSPEKQEKKDDRYLYNENGGIVGVNTEVLDAAAGKDATWSYDEESKTLSFIGEGPIHYPENYEPYKLYAEKIVIGDGITGICNSAFENFGAVTEVLLSDTVKYIDNRAFYNCSNMKGINLPAGLESIGKEAFTSCVSMTDITIPQNDMLFEIKSGTFTDCFSLMSAIIPPTIIYIEPNAFYGCDNLSIYCEVESFPYYYAETENIMMQTYVFD